MKAHKPMIATTILLATAILWFPAGDGAQAATPAWSPPPMVCEFDCRCSVVLGTPTDETTTPACYEETSMTVLTSTTGCCDGSVSCTLADECSWTIEISVTNDPMSGDCCYEILKDGIAIFGDSCTDSFQKQDSDAVGCALSHLYVLRGEGAECPSNPTADCLDLMSNVKIWEQRVHCQSDGMDCPSSPN